jgi:hypothetical protein
MSTDTEISRSLHQLADRAAVPPVDIDALRAGGRRHARRRRATVLGAAAVVLAVVAGGAVLGADALRSDPAPGPVQRDDRSTPRTVADLPVGGPPGLPFLLGDVIHAGDTGADLEGPGQLMGLRYGGGVTLGLHDRRGVVEVGPDGGQRVLDADATGYPAVSPGGRWAAWPVTADGRDARIVLWSLGAGKRVEVFSVPERPRCCDSGFHVAGVDDAGRVYVTGDRAHYLRDLGDAEPRVMDNVRAGSDEIKVGTRGIVVLGAPGDQGSDGEARFIDVVDGRLEPTTVLTAPGLARSTWWSPVENDQFLGRGTSGGLRVWSLDGPQQKASRPIGVPADVDVTGVAWESADAMLVDVVEGADAHAWWLRCSMERRTCERAADLGPEGTETIILPTR